MADIEKVLLEDHDMLIELHGMVKTVHDKVMGNGQPGLLVDVASLKTDVAHLKEAKTADKWAARGGGAMAISVIVSFIAKKLGLDMPV